jgi:hypothetical protein
MMGKPELRFVYYSKESGDDLKGEGTREKPFKTFLKATWNTPILPPPNVRYLTRNCDLQPSRFYDGKTPDQRVRAEKEKLRMREATRNRIRAKRDRVPSDV